jgi:tRNA pseudouridine55 synthase
VGAFTIEDSLPLDELERAAGRVAESLLPPEVAVAEWPAVRLDEANARRVRNGLALHSLDVAGERARAHGPEGALLALLLRDGDAWKPAKVFDWS